MKSALKYALSFTLALGVISAQAQSLPQLQHVIIVIQENRTPDNLFGGLPNFETGVDLAQPLGGQWCLGSCFNPDHGNQSWQSQFHSSGNACVNESQGSLSHCNSNTTTCNGKTACVNCSGVTNPIQVPTCSGSNYGTPYTYVSTTYDNAVVSPYFDIARKYGFANYFYQTNEGPSQPAHQFLFSGSSAPTGVNGAQYYNWFAASNPGNHLSQTGCDYWQDPQNPLNYQTVPVVPPDGNTHNDVNLAPCFDRPTLTGILEAAGLSWKYFSNQQYGIWTAPNAIKGICLGPNYQGPLPAQCTYQDFTNHLVTDTKSILTQIYPVTTTGQKSKHCGLPNVSWVVPDGTWSDRPGLGNGEASTQEELGPNWVASIVNSLVNTGCMDGDVPYQQDTVIFVVWDDWGGFYDHIPPYQVNLPPATCVPIYNGQNWGCGYTYGYRVPFLVISAYTPAGYVSGSCVQGSTCPKYRDSNFSYQHDFGSILAFIEYNFSLQIGGINLANGFPFADYFAPELQANRSAIPLADFFQGPLRGLATVQTTNIVTTPDYFINFSGPPSDPDNDAIDPQN